MGILRVRVLYLVFGSVPFFFLTPYNPNNKNNNTPPPAARSTNRPTNDSSSQNQITDNENNQTQTHNQRTNQSIHPETMSLRLFASRSMNLVGRTQRVAVARRAATTAASKPKTAQDIIRQKADFKQHWLSDPSTYPIMVVMATGIVWMCGMGVNGLGNKGVLINPNVRGVEMKEETGSHDGSRIMRKLCASKVKTEGLGIDHDKFIKQKEEYMSR